MTDTTNFGDKINATGRLQLNLYGRWSVIVVVHVTLTGNRGRREASRACIMYFIIQPLIEVRACPVFLERPGHERENPRYFRPPFRPRWPSRGGWARCAAGTRDVCPRPAASTIPTALFSAAVTTRGVSLVLFSESRTTIEGELSWFHWGRK